MKSHTLFQAAMRASRLLSCAALAASLAVLGTTFADGEPQAMLAGLMSPQTALCGTLLALAALSVSLAPRGCHAMGQALAVLACVVAFGPLLGDANGGWSAGVLSTFSPSAQAALGRLFPTGGLCDRVPLLLEQTHQL